MGNTIASCGHKLTRKQVRAINPVMVRALTRENVRAVSLLVLCPNCLKLAKSKGCVITSDPERERWLAGIGKGNVW